MDYSIGDKVMHPRHGGGTVTAIEEVELVEGFERYYAIEIPEHSMTLHIPMRKADELGIRPVMRESKLERVLETLRSLPKELADNYKARQAAIRKRLDTGRPLQVAGAVRDLYWRQEQDSLTQVDTKLLNRARDILSAEIALIRDVARHEATQLIDGELSSGLRSAPSGD